MTNFDVKMEIGIKTSPKGIPKLNGALIPDRDRYLLRDGLEKLK